jgi:hypothetical protein
MDFVDGKFILPPLGTRLSSATSESSGARLERNKLIQLDGARNWLTHVEMFGGIMQRAHLIYEQRRDSARKVRVVRTLHLEKQLFLSDGRESFQNALESDRLASHYLQESALSSLSITHDETYEATHSFKLEDRYNCMLRESRI